MIASIILAAGESKRMGTPKAILPFRGKTFVQSVIDLYTGTSVDLIIVVVGANALQVIEDIYEEKATAVMNEHYRQGQLSSLIAGLIEVEKCKPEAVFVHPVDHPTVDRETVVALLRAYEETKKPIVVPVFEGKRGHPVLFAASLFDELKSTPLNEGARAVVWSHGEDVLEVPVGDAGVLRNIDTPEAYENLRRTL